MPQGFGYETRTFECVGCGHEETILVGNSVGFGNRFLSALMSAIVFAIVFGALVYFGYGNASMSVTTTPSTTAPAQTQK